MKGADMREKKQKIVTALLTLSKKQALYYFSSIVEISLSPLLTPPEGSPSWSSPHDVATMDLLPTFEPLTPQEEVPPELAQLAKRTSTARSDAVARDDPYPASCSITSLTIGCITLNHPHSNTG
ncbi:hypothetical protein ACLOJK_028875 [Asimina triloba]